MPYLWGNFDATLDLSQESMTELQWWLTNLEGSYNVLQIPPIDLVIATDASLLGWGAILGNTKTGGTGPH